MIRRYNSQCNAVSFPTEQEGFVQSKFAESKVDKSYFRPENGILDSTVLAANRQPLFDYVGSSPHDIGLNLGWLRSKARDRVEIDTAFESVKDSIDAAKARDKANIDELKRQEAQLSDLASVLKSKPADSATEKQVSE